MYDLSREIIFKNDLIVRNTTHLPEAVNLPITHAQMRSFPCFLCPSGFSGAPRTTKMLSPQHTHIHKATNSAHLHIVTLRPAERPHWEEANQLVKSKEKPVEA